MHTGNTNLLTSLPCREKHIVLYSYCATAVCVPKWSVRRGKQLTIETLKAPQLLAPAFVFASENRFPVNIEAKEKCEILVINKNIFLEFLHQHPAVMRNFLQLVSDRTLFLSKKLNAFALQSLKSRILNYLRMHGTILNQQEVAQILGVARPSLARALSELASEGCIRMEEKEMRINAVSAQKYL